MSDASKPLAAEQVRWRCPEGAFEFETTADLAPGREIVAQPIARDALAFGLATAARGQNVYVRGPRGTGRMSMVREALAGLERRRPERPDRCYVHNFDQPDRPRLVSLPPGEARHFRRRVRELAEFIANDLPHALDSEPLASERLAIQERIRTRIDALTEPLEKELRRDGMALVSAQQGPMTQTMVFPLLDGEPVPPAELRRRVREGKATEERLRHFEEHFPDAQKKLQSVATKLGRLQREGLDALREATEQRARELLDSVTAPIRERFGQPAVSTFLDEVIADVLETRLGGGEQLPDPVARYGVNVVLEHGPGDAVPVVEENVPNLANLLGTVEFRWGRNGPQPSDYSGIRPGALLRADGGCLVLDVHDVLTEPGAWRALMRTLRTGLLEIVPPEIGWLRPGVTISPEPIDISVRVILVGDASVYQWLDALDPDFGEQFKVLADFDHEIERNGEGLQHYAAVIARITREEGLLAFDRSGVAALAEHGARIASRANRLTARFGRIADIAREAAFVAGQAGVSHVTGDQVREAVARTRKRAGLPSRKFLDRIHTGGVCIETRGSRVGQINALAVIHSGPLTFGFPNRVTATIGAGQAGLINIEGSASLSGSIHTKGFHILGGCLRRLLRAEHPLTFSASLAFEQSYGGVDGDSASCAEICCLLSALTDVPIEQRFAITGSIDQHGRVQAVGGVNEKIEGYFDVCVHAGLAGDQGVIIPFANRGDLMLRLDVVEAIDAGRFHIYAVERVEDALSLLTGRDAGRWEAEHGYADGSVLAAARAQARDYWRHSVPQPTGTHAPGQPAAGDEAG